MIVALPLLPLSAAFGLIALHRRRALLGPLATAALLATLALALWSALTEPAVSWRWSAAIELRLAVEGFARVMVVLVPAIAAPIIAYAAATERDGRPRLLALLLGFVGAMLLLVIAADFLSLLIGWELVGAASWALIGHDWRTADNAVAARQAFVTTRLGDLGLYLAAGLAFAAGGTLAFAGLDGVRRPTLDVIAAGVLLATAAKSAQVPFSPWLFAAMAGPTPVSALLHSATLVAAGAYLLVRLAPAFEAVAWFGPAVVAIGLVTALAGGIVAAVQSQAKRLLAASTSAQYGLMFVALGAGSTAAAGAHLVSHAAFKSLLFLGAGVAIHAAGTSELARIRVGRALPRIATLSAVGALALAAVPPLGGAWTKEQIVSAAAHSSLWLAALVLLAGFLTALYAARYQLLAFGAGPGQEHADDQRRTYAPGLAELGSIATLAVVSLALSLLWLPGVDGVVERATGGALIPGARGELLAGIASIAAAFALVWWLRRHRRLATLGIEARARAASEGWLGLSAATHVLVIAPVLALSRALAAFDDRVIDAGVRATAAFARLVSRLLSLHLEWTFDGVVRATAALVVRLASGSSAADDGAVDGGVEGSARGLGVVGRESRRLQTGLAHHYYVIVAAGTAAAAALLAAIR